MQLGAELEGPFGTDDNDLPLLLMGAKLCDDLDAILRTVRASGLRASQLGYTF